jgi:hypothetical protein
MGFEEMKYFMPYLTALGGALVTLIAFGSAIGSIGDDPAWPMNFLIALAVYAGAQAIYLGSRISAGVESRARNLLFVW